MWSPCGGCDPHLAAAIVCYLSFFISGCSFLLYWYWLGNYREEVNPLKERYSDPDASDCDALDPQGVNEEDEEEDYEGAGPSRRISSISRGISSREPLCTSASFGEEESFIINTITLPSPSLDLDSIHLQPGHLQPVDNHEGEEEEGEEEEASQRNKMFISNNPYLNGDTYTQNLLWGLHGILTNLLEAILSAIFYSGLFENNLTTTLVWVIGFSCNFILGNLLYLLLLAYGTNRQKGKQLWKRWTLETVFNVVKDLYYIWVGVAFLDDLVKRLKAGG